MTARYQRGYQFDDDLVLSDDDSFDIVAEKLNFLINCRDFLPR